MRFALLGSLCLVVVVGAAVGWQYRAHLTAHSGCGDGKVGKEEEVTSVPEDSVIERRRYEYDGYGTVTAKEVDPDGDGPEKPKLHTFETDCLKHLYDNAPKTRFDTNT